MKQARYRIEYYEPDGHGSSPDWIESSEPLHGREYSTVRAAKRAIRLRARGRGRYGQWRPDAAITAYHESRRVGCGGYAIVEIDAEPTHAAAAIALESRETESLYDTL